MGFGSRFQWMTGRSLRLAVLAFVLFGLFGCSVLRRRGPFPHVGLGEILSRLEERTVGIEDFEGRAEVRMWGMGSIRRAWLRVFFKKPDRMKLQVDGAFGIRVLEVLFCGGRLTAYFPTEDRFIEEPSETFWRNWVGLEIGWPDVRDVLLGTVSLGRADSVYVSEFQRTDEGYALVVEKGAFVRRLRVDGVAYASKWDLAATEEEVWDRSGHFIGRRTMGHFRKVDGVFLPERIELTQGKQRVEIAFISRRINRGLSDKHLELSVPEEMGP